MSRVFFISDLHIGHKSILTFEGHNRGDGKLQSVDEHDQWLIDQWNSVVTKRDVTWVLGDVCFDKHKLHLLKKMAGQKNLILGNHDKFSLEQYGKYFNKIHGFMKYKGVWLSHAPVHVGELRGRYNIHGHVHSKVTGNPMHIPVCVEINNGVPLLWEDLQKQMPPIEADNAEDL